MNPGAPLPLPLALRQDLQLYPSGPGQDGGPTWVIQDPVSNRFFRIGWLEYECLLRWPGRPEDIAADIEAQTPLSIDSGQVAEFARFLDLHQLTLPSDETQKRAVRQAREPGWRHWRWWLHHYLFIRIPLIRPQRFLENITPLLEPLFSPLAFYTLLAITLFGLSMLAHQWEHFSHSILDSLTPSGFLGFALALILSKSLHELGHAVTATRYGVRVAHMGIAFLVMWPMLYTDTGESWRLRSHRQRLAISAAGIVVELALAAIATLLWVILDDGVLRQATLYLATTGWLLSLALNSSPFMRFDGYFILSDLLNFPNLHERSSALAKVFLRRHLLGLSDLWPEPLPQKTRFTLIAFALTTWVYRLLIFLGIALTVYFFFFKALGILLMLVELIWFIARPAWMEVAVWKKRWPDVSSNRRRLIYTLLGISLLIGLIPWQLNIDTQGVAHAERQQQVFAPLPASLHELHPGGPVEAGQTIAIFSAPDIIARETQIAASAEALERRLAGLLVTQGGINQQSSLSQRLEEQQTALRGLREESGRLTITAEFSGLWRDVSPLLRPGSWLGTRDALGILVDPKSWVVDAYVEQRLIGRIQLGAKARFLPQGSLRALDGEVIEIDTTRTARLPSLLDSRHGGNFTTLPDEHGHSPTETLYRVRIRLQDNPEEIHEMRGSVAISSQPRSLIWEGLKGSLAALIRESGF